MGCRQHMPLGGCGHRRLLFHEVIQREGATDWKWLKVVHGSQSPAIVHHVYSARLPFPPAGWPTCSLNSTCSPMEVKLFKREFVLPEVEMRNIWVLRLAVTSKPCEMSVLVSSRDCAACTRRWMPCHLCHCGQVVGLTGSVMRWCTRVVSGPLRFI